MSDFRIGNKEFDVKYVGGDNILKQLIILYTIVLKIKII